MATRTTIYIDDELLERARQFVPARGLSSLLNELLAERIAALEREKIIAEMREGYIATREERREVARDWEAVALEGWPE
jgi:hypothetical protein